MRTLIAASLSLVACGTTTGTLQTTIYGEEFIEDQIPSTVFEDGWSAKFTKYLISVGELKGTRHGETTTDFSDEKFYVFDLTKSSGGNGHSVATYNVPIGRYDNLSYRIAVPPAGTTSETATVADIAMMMSKKYAVYFEAAFTKGNVTKTVKWGFEKIATFKECKSTANIVEKDGKATSQITIHADHPFYDDLFSTEAKVRFDLVASADTNMDGEITPAEALALDIRTQQNYQVGSTGIKDLWNFIAFNAQTIGHIDGEHECEIERDELVK